VAFHRSTAAREAGPAAIVVLVVAWGAIWLALRPPGQGGASYVGQLCGAESILLLSIALVLISTLPWVEVWFDGIDRAAIWHRRAAITGVVLLVPHILLSKSSPTGGSGKSLGVVGALGLLALVVWAIVPRWRSVLPRFVRPAVVAVRDLPGLRHARALLGGYERWRTFHRLTGVFVAIAFVHGILDATPFPGAPALRWIYVTIGGIGLAFYLYREFLARHFVALHDYQVERVELFDDGMMEISLKPLSAPMHFVPGQFAMLYLEAAPGWRRHPFSIASPPSSDVLRFTVKALGDDTMAMRESVQPGMPAVIRGPFGRFTHGKGGDHQVWIAGGVGIGPFLSWLRALDDEPGPGRIDFFYTSTDGGAPFASELEGIADRHQELRLHLVNSTVDGRLTPDEVLTTAGDDPASLSVFLCGPEGMVRTFQTDLHRAGVPRKAIHREYFIWR